MAVDKSAAVDFNEAQAGLDATGCGHIRKPGKTHLGVLRHAVTTKIGVGDGNTCFVKSAGGQRFQLPLAIFRRCQTCQLRLCEGKAPVRVSVIRRCLIIGERLLHLLRAIEAVKVEIPQTDHRIDPTLGGGRLPGLNGAGDINDWSPAREHQISLRDKRG
ncbi:hypothetical protein LP421_31945 (plasmid) [Rhizobium sp. RCAM05350]|nr:hypothetical protein LP421_31945 [Rhizobium sp. RCAM05350]